MPPMKKLSKVRDLVYSDRRIMVEEIANALHISHGSRQSVGPGSPRPKKLKTQPSAGKVMATVFWDAQCVIMDFLAKKSTITGAYYANLLL